MTKPLLEKTCTPCRGGVPPLTQQEAETLLAEAPEWALKDEAHRIGRTFRFKNFREALSFVQKVGELATQLVAASGARPTCDDYLRKRQLNHCSNATPVTDLAERFGAADQVAIRSCDLVAIRVADLVSGPLIDAPNGPRCYLA